MTQHGIWGALERWARRPMTRYIVGLFMAAITFAAAEAFRSKDADVGWVVFRSVIFGGMATLIYMNWARIRMLNRDITTGLYRRMVAENHLAALAKDRRDVTLVMIDLNDLRELNNQYGHDIGDDFIKLAAKRLSRLGRSKGRMVSRFGGGDEFLIICEKDTDTGQLAYEVEEALHCKHPLTGRWGIAVAGICRTRHGEVRVALECADMALYRAKRQHKAALGDCCPVLVYDIVLDGLPKYTQEIKPKRPKLRLRDM